MAILSRPELELLGEIDEISSTRTEHLVHAKLTVCIILRPLSAGAQASSVLVRLGCATGTSGGTGENK